ncbi:TraM recognition domain-containing protein, partial [Caballeronia novacaledonica]|uniref:TraM recognition domain-containing protein n=1 Tax=Caballeronia novacaledonica TaxID=1544861 RepID=UPI001EE18F81
PEKLTQTTKRGGNRRTRMMFLHIRGGSVLDAKSGSVSGANQHNQVCLRLEDSDTAKWFSDKVGETAIRVVNISNSTNTTTEAHALEFSGSQSRSIQLEKVPLIPVKLLHSLPNLQYFMRISGGAVYQGRIPIIEG